MPKIPGVNHLRAVKALEKAVMGDIMGDIRAERVQIIKNSLQIFSIR